MLFALLKNVKDTSLKTLLLTLRSPALFPFDRHLEFAMITRNIRFSMQRGNIVSHVSDYIRTIG